MFFLPHIQPLKQRILQPIIFFISHFLAPFVGELGTGGVEGHVAEPGVFLRAVPVAGIGGDFYHITGRKAPGGLALLLIPAFAIYADEDLAAAFLGVMDVPMVAATGLEGNIADGQGIAGLGEHLEIGISGEIFRISAIEIPLAKESAVLGVALGVHFFRHGEGCPGVRPAGVEGDVGQDFRHLRAGDAILLGLIQMVFQRIVGNAFADQCADGDDGAQLGIIGMMFVLGSGCIMLVFRRKRRE